MIRLGLCCKFSKEDIKFKTATVSYLTKLKKSGKSAHSYLEAILHNNIDALEKSIDFCGSNNFGCFRIGSDFFPCITHPDTKYVLEDFLGSTKMLKHLSRCKKKAKEKNIRLTMHPSQFTLLSSTNEKVTENAIRDLEYHAYVCELVGGDVINIHMGGAYGDKPAAISRVKTNVEKLSNAIRSRLTFENDDKTYSPEEILPVCKELNIPFVYDVHHHRCLTDSLSIEEATKEALTTWDREPLFHLSSPLEGWEGPKPHRHHDMIDPADFPECWKTLDNVTIEIEAKAKEVAIQDLLQNLPSLTVA